MAGGKVVKVDRVEWKWISDQQTAINALTTGEIDYMEAPQHDLLPVVKKDSNLKLVDINPLGNQYTFRFNVLHKPFDNAKIRQAVFYAFNQEDFLKATIGDPNYYKTCRSFYPCGTPFETTKGMEGLLESNFTKQELLKEAGYDGTPVVLMQSTDLAVLASARRWRSRSWRRAASRSTWCRWIGRPCRAACEEGSAERRWLECLPHRMGRGGHPKSRDDGIRQRRL